MNTKVHTLSHLAEFLSAERCKVMYLPNEQKRLVLCHGCFDVLHLGHVRHFLAAKELGDWLAVTVTSDRFVGKGDGRPVFNQAERAEMVSHLRCVDFVAINDAPNAVEAIRLLRPAVYVKGNEYEALLDTPENSRTQNLMLESMAVDAVGGRLEFTHELTFHSTDILKSLS
jgi:rfaE bifunctional protein nucleotidyltransferase chain/domain